MNKPTILVIARGYEQGGAEKMAYDVIIDLLNKGYNIHVISYGVKKEYYMEKILGIGNKNLHVYFLELFHKAESKHGASATTSMLSDVNRDRYATELSNQIKKIKGLQIIISVMSAMNVITTLALQKFDFQGKFYWWIHANHYKTAYTLEIQNLIIEQSKKKEVTKIMYCASSTADVLENLGLSKEKRFLLLNGVNVSDYYFSLEQRCQVRTALNIQNDSIVVLFPGKWFPIKGSELFVQSIKILLLRNSNLHVLLCGIGMTEDNQELMKLISDKRERFSLLGQRSDISAVMSASDIYVNASLSEARSLAIIEAKISGLHICATDVGDASTVLDESDSFILVEPNNIDNLKEGLDQIIKIFLEKSDQNILLKRQQTKEYHYCEKYSLSNMVNCLEQLFFPTILSETGGLDCLVPQSSQPTHVLYS